MFFANRSCVAKLGIAQLLEGAGSVIHTELRHMLPNSHVVSRTLCLAGVAGTGSLASLSRTTVRLGQRQHGSQRTLHRDRDCLALVCVVIAGIIRLLRALLSFGSIVRFSISGALM